MALSICLYIVARITSMKGNKQLNEKAKGIVREKYVVDYLLYGTFLLLKPGISWQFDVRSIWTKSKSGLCLMIPSLWVGFLLVTYYSNTLLSYLTAPMYEKSVDTISGMYIINMYVLHIQNCTHPTYVLNDFFRTSSV